MTLTYPGLVLAVVLNLIHVFAPGYGIVIGLLTLSDVISVRTAVINAVVATVAWTVAHVLIWY